MSEVSRYWEIRYVDSYGMVMHTTVFHDIEAARDEMRRSPGKTTTATGWTVRLGRDDVSEVGGLHEAQR
jgi:hypothetical protein